MFSLIQGIRAIEVLLYYLIIYRHANLQFATLGHATSRDVVFGGYSIPMEATILADLDSIHSDRSVWKDPEVFRPQRFIAEDGTIQNPEEFIPFFTGNLNI